MTTTPPTGDARWAVTDKERADWDLVADILRGHVDANSPIAEVGIKVVEHQGQRRLALVIAVDGRLYPRYVMQSYDECTDDDIVDWSGASPAFDPAESPDGRQKA